jgi:ethanolamine utilization cobalamin adenosyltransferase
MNIITESELRELWQNGRGQLPSFPRGTRFSASAQDFLKSNHIEARFDELAQIQSGAGETWDKPGTFPVVLTGSLPVCFECGQPLHTKPEHLTQLDAGHFAPKTSLRLVLRGRVDSLHAIVMLTAATSRKFELPELAHNLDSLAAYCREIMSAEYNMRLVAPLVLMGKNEEELHEISHWPDRHLGINHIVPGPFDHEILHWLNVLRTQCREVEVVALHTFPPEAIDPTGVGASLSRAFNRLSSAVYVLELYFQAGKLSWKASR